jgi:putative Holliday junction resolvase
MGRIAALDWGRKRIGFSVSDEEQLLAHQVNEKFVNDASFEKKFRQFLKTCPVEKLLIGLPTTLTGGVSSSTAAARAFGNKLSKKFGLPVEFLDERFTSRLAQQKLAAHHYGRGRKAEVDNIAAQLLLQEYLDAKRSSLK